jgi:hypothetical protein
MGDRITPGDFAKERMTDTLNAMRARREQLQVFIDEAEHLDVAIKEQEGALERFDKKRPLMREYDAEQLAARPARDSRPVPPARETPAALPPSRRRGTSPTPGTNLDRAVRLLKEHPRGLNTSVIARQCQIPNGSISVVLTEGVDRGLLIKVGRGFYRVKAEQDAAEPVAA